ncbi:MAG: transporter substrate-binding domain-containing protein [Spirochaetaceae bacterium]|jgi:polar amino acid transport system substrate-binding protein|nr:transporter substrate-binding domain-containing protein [Spirochaetaceae bacterium]
MKKLLFVLLAFMMAVAAFAGGQQDASGSLEKIKKAGKIRIGIFSDTPPFGFVDAKGIYQGYDVYFAHRIAKDMLGDENAIEFVSVDPANRVEFLQSDKVDIIMANFTVTPDRALAVDFTLPYMKVAIGIVSPDRAPIKKISDLEGKELIVNPGTTSEVYFAKNYPKIKLQKYEQISAGFNALKDGRAPALAQDNTVVFAWSVQNPGFTTTIQSIGSLDTIAAAVRKGNKELLDWLNNEISTGVGDTFFHDDYKATLLPVYGKAVDPESVVVEHGVVK